MDCQGSTWKAYRSPKREPILDVMKRLLILLVILGHNVQYLSGTSYLTNKLFFENFVFKFIYSFHMHAFALVSGYLFYRTSTKYNGWVIAKRKFNSLLRLLMKLRSGTLDGNAYSAFLGLFNSFWFLWAILFCSLIT